jgi:hypothetical protein
MVLLALVLKLNILQEEISFMAGVTNPTDFKTALEAVLLKKLYWTVG